MFGIRNKMIAIPVFLCMISAICGVLASPTVVVEEESPHPGTRITVSGSGFPGSADFEIFIDNESVASDTSYPGGTFHRKMTLPRQTTIGLHNLTAVSGSINASTEIRVVQWPAAMNLSPSILKPGQDLTICGRGYPPNAFYRVDICGNATLEGATDENGTFCRLYSVPKQMLVGDCEVTGKAPMFAGPPSAAEVLKVDQWEPELVIDPSDPYPGAFVSISGSHLPPLSRYEILLDGASVRVGTSDARGEFSRNYQISPHISTGNHVLEITATKYTGPPRTYIDFEVIQWPCEITLEPIHRHPGSNVTVKGRFFPPNTRFVVSLDNEEIGSGNTSSRGRFSFVHEFRNNATLGEHTISGVTPQFTGPPKAELSFNLTQWPLLVDIRPSDIHPGSNLTLTGSQFPPAADFEVYMDSSKRFSGITSGDGNFTISIVLSRDIALGLHDLTFTVDGYSGPPTRNYRLNITQWRAETGVVSDHQYPGGLITVIGCNYPPESVYFALVDGVKVGGGVIDVEGCFQMDYQLNRTIDLGAHELSISTGFPGLDHVNRTFEVSQWPMEMYLEPENALPGSTVNVVGQGFPPNASVKIIWDDLFVKAGEVSSEGEFDIQFLPQGQGSGCYHVVGAQVRGDYTGPPSCYVYFWLGDDPPEMKLDFCDELGRERDHFFPGDTIHISGSGFPSNITFDAYIGHSDQDMDPTLASLEKEITADGEGRISCTPVGDIGEEGLYRAWLDLNRNGMADGTDTESQSSFEVLPRPDLGILEVTISNDSPVQGQRVDVWVKIKNYGGSTQQGVLALEFNSSRDTEKIFSISSGSTVNTSFMWNTSDIEAGKAMLCLVLEPLEGETSVGDNYLEWGLVEVEAAPDIRVNSVLPGTRSVHRGKDVEISIGIENKGSTDQNMSIWIEWGEEVVGSFEAELDSGTERIYEFTWDTSEASMGERTIAARAEVLAWERDPRDNHVQNGFIEIRPSNRLPRADPHGPYSGSVGEPVTFDGSWSYDVDGRVVTYRWAFGDGTTGTGMVVNHTYSGPGKYEIMLEVMDDDGDSSSQNTTAGISSQKEMHQVSIVVRDAVNLVPLADLSVCVGREEYLVEEFPLDIWLEEGEWRVSINKTGYQRLERWVSVNESLAISLAATPDIRFFASDERGGEKVDYSITDTVYVTVVSPRDYSLRFRVVRDGKARSGEPLVDISTDGYDEIVAPSGSSTYPVWENRLELGSYDIVLDTNSNGIFDADTDLQYRRDFRGFQITENGLLGLGLWIISLSATFLAREQLKSGS